MKIRGQKWEVTGDYIVLKLLEPYWSAYKRFGWTEGVEGYSVSYEAVNKAFDLKKKILVRNKYGDYEITPNKAIRYGGRMLGRDGTELVCVPKTAFKKLPPETEEQVTINPSVMQRLGEEFFKKYPELKRNV